MGAIEGLYTATILRQLEEVLGRPIASHFDLICGTSVGGILALGLAAEILSDKLQAIFEEKGECIFGSRSIGRRLNWLFHKSEAFKSRIIQCP